MMLMMMMMLMIDNHFDDHDDDDSLPETAGEVRGSQNCHNYSSYSQVMLHVDKCGRLHVILLSQTAIISE